MLREHPDPSWLRDWLTVCGWRVVSVTPFDQPGRSRRTWLADVEDGDGSLRRGIIREEQPGGPWAGTAFTLSREATLLEALAGTAVPVPRLWSVHPEGRALLMERLPGRSDQVGEISDRASPLASFVSVLADLHRLDPASLKLPFTLPSTRADHVLCDLGDYELAYRLSPRRLPVLESAIEWVKCNPPEPVRTSVLHGDPGPGNFLHRDGHVTGVIDWEMAHAGDPADDLAWLWFRFFLTGKAGYPTVLNHYRFHSGLDVQTHAVCVYRVLVLVRCVVADLMMELHDPSVGPGRTDVPFEQFNHMSIGL